MRTYENRPYWVRKDDPTCIVQVREFNSITSMWNPKADNHLVVQRLDKPVFDKESYEERVFLKQFKEFVPPKPKVRVTSEAPWWRDKKTPAIFVLVWEVLPWKGPNNPVRVHYGTPNRGEDTVDESDFLERFEKSGPPPDKRTAWGKVWDDD